MSWADQGNVRDVTITGQEIAGTTKVNEPFHSYVPSQYEGFVNKLIEKGVVVKAKEPTASPWATLLYSWGPMLLIIGFWIFFMRQVQSGGNKALSFAKSKAKLSSSSQKKVTVEDVDGGHDEREQTLNQLLVEMDGFESNEGVILVAATNRPDVLDPALLRPGRFDRRIVVNRPDVKGREGILAVHTRKIPMSDDVQIAVLARGSAGFSRADLANLVNEAALNAARYNQKVVRMHDFESAKDKVLM